MIKLAPSLLAADYARLGECLALIENAGAAYAHLDVMDGHFVKKISMGSNAVKSIRKVSKLVFDVHLMVAAPERQIEFFANAGADIITFHYEAAFSHDDIIRQIRSFDVRPSMAISPHTPTEALLPWITKLDMVLIMSVQPGSGGQELIRETLGKARILREYITKNRLDCDIQMDGGINRGNLRDVIASGVNVVVSGTDIFSAPDVGIRVKEYLDLF